MVSPRTILNTLPPPKWERENIVKYHVVNDIVCGTMDMHKKSEKEYDRFSEKFWRGNDIKTAECLFDFCKKHLPYGAEPDKDQTGKHPAVIISDGLSGNTNDCKHYSLFINGVMASLARKGYDIKPIYVFASDQKRAKEPTHVFCAIKLKDGLVWVDPVLDYFNQPHKYYYFKEYKIPNVMYSHVSGVTQPYGWVDGIGKHGKGKAKFKKFVKKIAPGQFLLKTTLAPSRNSFLLLLKLNAFGMAKKLFEFGQTPQGKQKLQNLWKKVGGKWSVFASNINKGYKHYLKARRRIMPSRYHMLSGTGGDYIAGIEGATDLNAMVVSGLEPQGVGAVHLAAVLAAAAPILKAFSGLLKQLGINPNDKVISESVDKTAILHNDGSMTSVTTEVEETPGQKPTLRIKDVQQNHLDNGAGSTPGADIITPQRAQSEVDNPLGREVQEGGVLNYGTADALKRQVATREASQEIPFAESAPAKAVNVITDWGRGISNFIENNKPIFITGAVIGGSVLLVRAVTGHGTRRK